MSAEIKQLPVTTNLSNLGEAELVSLANTKYEAGIDALIKAAYCVKECGEVLQELKARYSAQGSRKGKSYQSLFRNQKETSPQIEEKLRISQLKLVMSKAQADRYIAVAKSWNQIEPTVKQEIEDLLQQLRNQSQLPPSDEEE